MKTYDEEIQRLLKAVVDDCKKEDRATRERQIRTWRRLKLYWEGFQNVWYSETAHDWRIYDNNNEQDSDQAAYDKPINVFRAYLESIIAALSVTVPPVKCYPDDADNPLDLSTAKAGDKISELIYRHNDVPLLWLHALFIYATEGMVACYSYPKEDVSYGTYQKEEKEDVTENHKITSCPLCGNVIDDSLMAEGEELLNQEKDEFMPGKDDVTLHDAMNRGQDICPSCIQQMDPEIKQESFIVTRIVGTTTEPKSRVCLEAYGGLFVKIPNYARKQSDCPYLIYSYETDYSIAVERYQHLHGNKKLLANLKSGKTSGSYDQYDQWGRLNPQYQGEYPINVVTIDNTWLRPAKFNILSDEDAKKLKKLFPDGVKVVLVGDEFAEACVEALDDYWTLTYNPLSDYLHFDPLGLLLTSIQDITNDLTSLTLQTIEHGVGLTFVDPAFVNLEAYAQTEVLPGAMIPSKAISGGKRLADGFFEVRTSILSGEVLPFAQSVQSMGQLVSGALPSLFGGSLAGSDTASEYSMSRAQSMQRLQTSWKMLTYWWKNVFGKAIPMYIKEVKEDERDVKQDKDGNFINSFIRKADLEGKIGKVELEANENLPLTWAQQKDTIEKLLQAANPEVLKIIAAPENYAKIRQSIGLTDFFVPGEDDVTKTHEVIKLLVNSEPIQVPPSQDMLIVAQEHGVPPPEPEEIPSLEPEVDIDNYPIVFEICRNWLVSEIGRQAKTDNANGYKNVLLYAKMLKQYMAPPPPQPVAPKINYSFKGEDLIDPQVREILDRAENLTSDTVSNGNGANPAKPNSLMTQEAPITGESNVQTVQ